MRLQPLLVVFCRQLDPFNQATDDAIWHALRQAHLLEFVAGLEGQLQHLIAEGGQNMSQGQRQQVALARAILRRPKIFLMDEGTSSVDNVTDQAIQTAIRESFRDATTVTIAHRIDTILDSDRVLVMNTGEVAEFDTPTVLLGNPNSMFSALAAKAS
jgi:ATP-binding cassette subfamily C (CFTR/MRP) protein 1